MRSIQIEIEIEED